MKDGVSIVIPTWNGLPLLKRFLPSVLAEASLYIKQTNSPVEVILVDDGSVDETIEWLIDQGFEEKGKSQTTSHKSQISDSSLLSPAVLQLKFLRNEMNLGFGEACNRGFAAASYKQVFLLNNDVKVGADSIAPLVENFADPALFAVHCRVFELETGKECGTGKVGSFSRGFIRVHGSYNVDRSTDQIANPSLYSIFASGGSAMFDRDKFLSIGGFEKLLSPLYWEDVDISYRAWKRGYHILYEPRSVVRHRVSSTTRRLSQRRLQHIQRRNRLIYHWINLHDGRMFLSHILWVILLAVTFPLRLDPGFISSCLAGLKLLPEIRKRRREERKAAKRSDRDVFEIFKNLKRRSI